MRVTFSSWALLWAAVHSNCIANEPEVARCHNHNTAVRMSSQLHVDSVIWLCRCPVSCRYGCYCKVIIVAPLLLYTGVVHVSAQCLQLSCPPLPWVTHRSTVLSALNREWHNSCIPGVEWHACPRWLITSCPLWILHGSVFCSSWTFALRSLLLPVAVITGAVFTARQQSAVLAMIDSVWPTVWPSVTRWYHAKTTPATIMPSSWPHD